MEKFFLSTFFSYDKLDIINKKNIIVAVFFSKFRGGDIVFVPDRINQLIRKLL